MPPSARPAPFALNVLRIAVVLLAMPAQHAAAGSSALIGREIVKKLASDGAAGDGLGYSVALSGDIAVVGAWGDDDYGNSSGAAYVFYRNLGGADRWGELKKLTASDAKAADYFGYSVAIDGDSVVVGAVGDDDGGSESGSAYVFYRNLGGADAWGEAAKLTASDGSADDWFGYSVALSGDTAVVGSRFNTLLTGAAYVFSRNQGGADAWGEAAKLTASDGTAYNGFGLSVALSGDTAVVGAYGDDQNGSASGAVYVFTRNRGGADAWGEAAKLTASDGAADDRFGVSVAVSGQVAVIGADGDDDHGEASGSVYVVARNQGGADAWGEAAKITASDGAANDLFGGRVALSGDVALVQAYGDDDAGSGSGSVYVLSRNQGGAGAWGEAAKLTASDGAAGDHFGYSALSGTSALVGAVGDDDNGISSGSVYVYRLLHPTDDFNSDGKADILWRHGTSGDVYTWAMNGDVPQSIDLIAEVPDLTWQIAGSGDLNADGFTDILWRNSVNGMIYAWLVAEGAIVGQGTCGLVADPEWVVVGLRDTSGDGKADVLWRNTASGELYLWIMDGLTMVRGSSLGTVSTGWRIEN